MAINSPATNDTNLPDNTSGLILPSTVRVVNDSLAGLFTSTQTASCTLALTDRGTCINMNLSADGTVTIPTNASVAFDIGTRIRVRKVGVGDVNITPISSAVTLLTKGSWTIVRINTHFDLHKTGTDTWVLSENNPRLINSDYCQTTTDDGGAAGSGAGLIPIYGNGMIGSTVAAYSRVVTTAAGGSGPNGAAYRSLTAQSGDSMGSSGIRCQLGENNWVNGWGYNVGVKGQTAAVNNGAFQLFREGDHCIIEMDLRLGGAAGAWNIAAFPWQTPVQVKQSQPGNNGGASSPVFELAQYAVFNDGTPYWSYLSDTGSGSVAVWNTPAVAGDVNNWKHIKIDCLFSQYSAIGFIQLQVGSVISPRFVRRTALPEVSGTNTQQPVGATMFHTLMFGPYLNGTTTTSGTIDVANIEIWDCMD